MFSLESQTFMLPDVEPEKSYVKNVNEPKSS